MRLFLVPMMFALFGAATAHAATTGPRNPFPPSGQAPCLLDANETGCIEAPFPKLHFPHR